MNKKLPLLLSLTVFSFLTSLAQIVNLEHAAIRSETSVLESSASERHNNSDAPHTAAIQFDSSNLPIVYIRTNWQSIGDEPKITAEMGIIDNGYNQTNYVTDTPNDYDGLIGIERRGSISQLWPQKSYSVETRDSAGNSLNVSLLGMPSENDWILYGPFDDRTMMRNVMTYQLGREMGYWAPRTYYVELVINTYGFPEYQGVYVLMEKIKRDNDRVNISKLDSTENSGDDLTGGYIFAIDKNIWANDSGFYSSNPQNLFFTYKYPGANEITQPQKDYLKAYVDSFETAMAAPNFDDLNNGFRKYAYEQSFMDYFFFTEMSKNIDAYKRSSYFYKDKYSDGGKLHCGPLWDYNSAWYNIHYCGFDVDTGWAYPMTCWISSAPVPFWWEKMLEDSIYSRDLKCRWTTWRSTVLDTAHIFHIIDSIADYIRPAAVRQYDEYNFTETFQGQVDTLKWWIANRITWMDANMPGNCWNLSVSESQLPEEMFTVYPNPAGGELYIGFNFPANEKISIEIIDPFGKKVENIPTKNYASGENKITIGLSGLSSGVYFIHIVTESGSVTKRIIKM
ncbi:MAG: CotH kinase family protein [Bacteroidota bacterium]|nr:CotH kinase family protein [Bacteroidota bacterium]